MPPPLDLAEIAPHVLPKILLFAVPFLAACVFLTRHLDRRAADRTRDERHANLNPPPRR